MTKQILSFMALVMAISANAEPTVPLVKTDVVLQLNSGSLTDKYYASSKIGSELIVISGVYLDSCFQKLNSELPALASSSAEIEAKISDLNAMALKSPVKIVGNVLQETHSGYLSYDNELGDWVVSTRTYSFCVQVSRKKKLKGFTVDANVCTKVGSGVVSLRNNESHRIKTCNLTSDALSSALDQLKQNYTAKEKAIGAL